MSSGHKYFMFYVKRKIFQSRDWSPYSSILYISYSTSYSYKFETEYSLRSKALLIIYYYIIIKRAVIDFGETVFGCTHFNIFWLVLRVNK